MMIRPKKYRKGVVGDYLLNDDWCYEDVFKKETYMVKNFPGGITMWSPNHPAMTE
jgi:hypothetical protein